MFSRIIRLFISRFRVPIEKVLLSVFAVFFLYTASFLTYTFFSPSFSDAVMYAEFSFSGGQSTCMQKGVSVVCNSESFIFSELVFLMYLYLFSLLALGNLFVFRNLLLPVLEKVFNGNLLKNNLSKNGEQLVVQPIFGMVKALLSSLIMTILGASILFGIVILVNSTNLFFDL